MRALLITDIDNTLYNWVDYFAPAFRAMVHALSLKTNIPEDVFYQDFREVFVAYSTLEYSYAVQELRCLQHFSGCDIDSLIKLAMTAFGRSRRKSLNREAKYVGVYSTLKWARRSGAIIVAATGATRYFAGRRIARLGLRELFDALVCQADYKLPEGWETKRKLNEPPPFKIWTFSAGRVKSDGYATVLEHFGVVPDNTYVVGDSISSDLKPAAELGCKGIWARYGRVVKEENLETILRITPWPETETKKFYSEPLVPYAVIESFNELRNIIELPQCQLGLQEGK